MTKKRLKKLLQDAYNEGRENVLWKGERSLIDNWNYCNTKQLAESLDDWILVKGECLPEEMRDYLITKV